jgi:hypothetical protein
MYVLTIEYCSFKFFVVGYVSEESKFELGVIKGKERPTSRGDEGASERLGPF